MASGPPSARRILASAAAALLVGLGAVSVLVGVSGEEPLRSLQRVAIVGAAIVLVGALAALAAVRLGGWREPASEHEFEAVVERSERLAREGVAADPGEDDFLALDPHDDADFEELVREALDDLPDVLVRALEHVAVVISDGGRRRRAYGLYHGDGVARDEVADRIVIYRDTLRRDFGHDPDLLRGQVTRTVRHELAHHLGWSELGVRGLGL